MNWDLFLNLAFGLCVLTEVAYIVRFFLRSRHIDLVIRALLVAGLCVLTVSVAFRWIDAGHPPFASMYESVVFFAWATSAAFVIMLFRGIPLGLGAPVTGIVILALGYASLLDDAISPLLPALRSNWLTVHVISYFIAYGVLAVSFVASAILLATGGKKRVESEPASDRHEDQLDTIAYRGVTVAFPLMTIGLITGAVWADRTWGRYWGWDPKENLSLVCWLVYAAYLHVRLVHGWRGKRAAVLAVVGFLFVLFTFLGLKYLPLAIESLHRYV